jgi:prophage regulatory protein
MAERLIRMDQVKNRVCLSKTTIYRKIEVDEFPRPVPIGTQRVAWIESEIDAWIADRAEARDQHQGQDFRRDRARRSVKQAQHCRPQRKANDDTEQDAAEGRS